MTSSLNISYDNVKTGYNSIKPEKQTPASCQAIAPNQQKRGRPRKILAILSEKYLREKGCLIFSLNGSLSSR